jgi:hypothetical protein
MADKTPQELTDDELRAALNKHQRDPRQVEALRAEAEKRGLF